MRLSLWTQYSSNNSNDFDLVGEFQTSEEAQQRGLELRTLLERIEKFYVDEEGNVNKWEPQRVENEISHQYAIKIQVAIDWLDVAGTSQRAMRVFDNRLYLSSLMRSVSTGVKPFNLIIEKMGAEVLHTGSGALLITFTCLAPDSASASEMIAQTQRYLQITKTTREESRLYSPPWIGYANGQYDAEIAELAQKWNTAYEQHEAFIAALTDADDLDAKYTAWQQQFSAQDWRYALYLDFNNRHALYLDFDNFITHPLVKKWWGTLFDVGFARGWIYMYLTQVSHNDQRITLKGLSFYNPGMAIEAVIAWLNAQGCTQIQHSYEDGREVLKTNEA